MAIAGLLGAGMRSAGGAMAKSGAKAMTKGMIGRRNKPNQQKSQPEVQKVNVKVAGNTPQTGNQISNLSSFLSLPEAQTTKSGRSEGVEGIEEKLSAIRDFFAQRFAYSKSNSREKTVKDDRKKKNKREEELEKEVNRLKKKVKVKSALPNVGIFDSIKNFFLYTFLAFLEKKFNFTSQLVKLLPLINGVMDFVIDIGGKILNGLATFIDIGYGLVDNTRKFIENIGGAGLLNAFDKVLGVVNTILNALFIYAMAQSVMPGGGSNKPGRGKPGRSGPGGVSSGSRPGQGFRPKVTTTGGGGLNRPDIRNPLRDRPRVTTTGGGTPGRPDIRNPLRSRPTITTGLGKAAAGEAVEKVTKKTAMLAVGKFISPFVKRIPIFGALIDFAINIALGESVGRSIAKAAGAGIGAWAGGALGGMLAAAVGSVVPIAGTALGGAIGFSAGSVLGGMFGDFLGGWLYDRIAGVDPVQAKSGGGVVTYNNGGEVSDNKEKKLELLPKEKLSTSFNKNDEDTDFNKYLKDSGERLKDIPIVGPIMATAIKALLGHDVKLKDFETIAKGITNVSSLISSGSVETSSDYSRFRSYALGGSVVDDEVNSGQESKVNANNLARFLDTKFNAAGGVGDVLKSGEGKPGSTSGPGSKEGERDSATGALTPGSGSGGGGVYAPILDLIAKYESGSGGYESMYPGTTLPGATKMTMTEVAQKATGAVGMYQNMPRFIVDRAKAVGLDPNTALYNEENQRKIAVYLIEEGQAGVTPQMLKDNPDEAMIRLARVWAAIPVPKAMQGHSKQLTKGESYYAGDGANKAHITPEMMYTAMGASVQIQADIASGKLTPGVPGGPGGDPAKGEDGKQISVGGGSIVSIGKDLISKGFAVAEHPDFSKQTPSGSYTPGSGSVSNVHKGDGHYDGRAIDVTNWRGGDPEYKKAYLPILDSLANNDAIKMLIHDTWGFQDATGKSGPGAYGHPQHMHIETKMQGGGLIGKSPKKYGDMTSKASYEKSGSQVMIQPIIIEKVNQSPMMTPPISALTFSTNGVVNTNNNPVLSRG